MGISMYFRESLGVRDNESRLYISKHFNESHENIFHVNIQRMRTEAQLTEFLSFHFFKAENPSSDISNSIDHDRTPQHAASDQGLSCLLTCISMKMH